MERGVDRGVWKKSKESNYLAASYLSRNFETIKPLFHLRLFLNFSFGCYLFNRLYCLFLQIILSVTNNHPPLSAHTIGKKKTQILQCI